MAGKFPITKTVSNDKKDTRFEIQIGDNEVVTVKAHKACKAC